MTKEGDGYCGQQEDESGVVSAKVGGGSGSDEDDSGAVRE